MKSRTPNPAAMAFIYEHKRTHESVCVYGPDAGHYTNNKWHHAAGLMVATWCHLLFV